MSASRWIRCSLFALAAAPLSLACMDIPMPGERGDDALVSHSGAIDAIDAIGGALLVHFEAGLLETTSALGDVAGPELRGPIEEPGPSAPEPAEAVAIDAEPERFVPDPKSRWLVHAGRLVLAQGDAIDASWADGNATMVQQGHPDAGGLFIARKELRVDALPESLRALAGAEVKVFDHEREVCVARIGATPSLTAELLHMRDDWDMDEGTPLPSHSADEVFESGATILGVGLDPLIGDCQAGLWATPVAATTPTLFREVAVTKRLERKAIAAFRALPAWKHAQHEMETYYGDEPSPSKGQRWDTLYGTRPIVTLHRSHDGRREIVVVHGNSVEGCGSEGQQLTSLFTLEEIGERERLVELMSFAWTAPPDGIVDLDADGVLEMFTAKEAAGDVRLERWHGDRPAASEDNGWKDERFEAIDAMEIPDLTFYGCPC